MLAARLGSVEAAHKEFGVRSLANLLESSFGKTLLGFGLGDAKGILSQVSPGYKTMFSFGTRSITWTDNHRGQLRFQRDFLLPECHIGVIEYLLRMLKCRHIQVVGKEPEFMQVEIDVSWD